MKMWLFMRIWYWLFVEKLRDLLYRSLAVKRSYSGFDYEHFLSLGYIDTDLKPTTLLVHSRQIKYEYRGSFLLSPVRTRYMYHVRSMRFVGLRVLEQSEGYYPHLLPESMAISRVAHAEAIKLHLRDIRVMAA